ncbi:TRAP transporter small permease [Maritimibacter sp. HL-12]|uniref:TRAP transporter small permease n=1 Tax=Maritimibacter sp. HL-12 TaxID=1162418 RepID=UPI000A0F12D4|nr:TRAP transporter small permease subunit [Maritimibacter sp. HL-12]SMH39030.1 Tripartite ATP-independent transporter, DctQ component [Maritimibacter sp. HL-12]
MRPVERFLGVIVQGAAVLGIVSLLALMALTVVTVTFRAIGIAFPGTYVLAELLLIPTVSCALVFAAREDAHTRVDLLVQSFNRRLSGLSKGLTLLAGTVFWGFVLYAGIEEALRRGKQGEVTPLLDIPVAPFRWLMVTAIAVLIAVCVLGATRLIAGWEARK